MLVNSSQLPELPDPEGKPSRLYFETYLAIINGAPGTEMFRHFYIKYPDGSEFDATEDGSNSCAFFVSSVLTILQKIKRVHGTVNTTIEDLSESGWRVVSVPKPGDVIIWAATVISQGHQHIGFYVGDNLAVSTTVKERAVTKHDIHFGAEQRTISHIYRMSSW